jgi:hypothetical protein
MEQFDVQTVNFRASKKDPSIAETRTFQKRSGIEPVGKQLKKERNSGSRCPLPREGYIYNLEVLKWKNKNFCNGRYYLP